MKKKKKKSKKINSKKKRKIARRKVKNRRSKRISSKRKRNSKKPLKKKKRKDYKKKYNSKSIFLKLIRFQNRIKPRFKYSFNLDKILQNFFQKIADKVEEYKNIREEENRRIQLKINEEMKKEKLESVKRLKFEKQERLQEKQKELQEEKRFERERKKDLHRFIRIEQALVRKEQADKQRKFLEQIKLEKKIEQFRKRETLEIKNLEKFVLSQERDSYAGVQERIEVIKKKYQALRDQKIRERVEQLGIEIKEGEDRSILLEKERIYNLERQKIEFALESFYRSAHSLVFQLNKRYIPKYLSILRTIDRRFENGEIFVKFDESSDDDWLLLIYIKNNNPDEGIVIEDKTNPGKNISHEFKSSEIFQASDMMVDALTKLLDKEREKRKLN
tara:strand:- start:33 stop:1199 length:1167 start_codon:yes stop_codon:yes gene_type:complete